MHHCPLCKEECSSSLVPDRDQRLFYRCERCSSWHLDQKFLPERSEEFERYRLHNNSPKSSGYRKFLGQLAEPVLERISAKMIGLDYGCGPFPVLSQLFEEKGASLEYFDPFFYPEAALRPKYDYVTCSECAEHFHKPAAEFDYLQSILKPGGLLAVMTDKLQEDTQFRSWYYAKDPTHVFFYSDLTFKYIGEQFGFRSEQFSTRITFLEKL